MIDKKIIFCATKKEMPDIWPHPQPASRMIPNAYRKVERFTYKDLHRATVKTCMPFLDSMTAGYIIPFDQDYIIDPVENDFTISPASQAHNEHDYHNKNQLPVEWHSKTGEHAGKFINKWLIKTPPGYSCLFVHPMNRYDEDRFKIIEGIVDTDTYISTINFPFILLKRDKQFLIKKGDPMVQVIPFKRESWKKWSGYYHEKKHIKTIFNLTSLWINKYKQLFWHKKSFK